MINKTKIKSEAMRYLGYNNQAINQELDLLINLCIDEIIKNSQPKSTYKIFGISQDKINNTILVNKTSLILTGKSIFNHLKYSEYCAIFAATLGVSIDNLIKICEITDMAKALILDACANAYIEEVCDLATEEIADFVNQDLDFNNKNNIYNINFRFSPGYGDLSLEFQPKILKILDAQKKIGLNLTSSYILIPRKSVTAIIGINNNINNNITKSSNCETCNLKNTCEFNKA